MLNKKNNLILSAIYILFTTFVNKSLQLTECQFTDNSYNPCIHGICLAANDSLGMGYQCYCNNGYTGINCTKKYDNCLHRNLCQNSCYLYQ